MSQPGTAKERWTNDDFESMSWHDVHCYGFELSDFDENLGSADLTLDIDYILQWIKQANHFEFVVAKTNLRFHQVFDLRLHLDYKVCSAGMCAFSIGEIKRERVEYPNGNASFLWRVDVNWPNGCLEFQSPGFTQELLGPQFQNRQMTLTPEQRRQ